MIRALRIREANKNNKNMRNSGARGGWEGPTPRLHAPPAGPTPARTRIWRFFCGFFYFAKAANPAKTPGF